MVRFRAVLLAVVCLLFPASALASSLALFDHVGPPTATVPFGGAAFTPGTTVDIYFESTLVASQTVAPDGTIGGNFTVPADAQPGRHLVTTMPASQLNYFTVRTDWPQFHGPTAAHDGVNPYENTLTEANAASLALLWKQDLDFGSTNTPAVKDGRVFFPGPQGVLYGFNAFSGRTLPGFPINTGDFFFRATPAIVRGGVYVPSFTLHKLYGFNEFTGAALPGYPKTLGGASWGSLTVTDSRLFAGTDAGTVEGYALATGDPLPGYPLTATGGVVASMSLDSNNRGFFGTTGGTFYAVNIKTGAVLWSVNVGSVITSTAAVYGNTVYFGSDNGNLYALDTATGAPRSGFPIATGGPIGDSPTVTEDGIFFGSFDKYLHHHNRKTGRLIRKLYRASEIWGSTLLANGVIIVKSLGSVSLISVATGQVLWNRNIGSSQSASTALADGVLYVGGLDGIFRAFSVGGVRPPPPP